MSIKFVDLQKQYVTIKEEIDEAIAKVVSETAFIKGKYVEEFEEAFAEKIGAKHCIGVANGTDALFVALDAVGIGRGDDVITVANSWISTSESISLTGANPVFIDIEEDFFNIDVSKIEDKITKYTKAILPVHLYGQPAKIEEIKAICDKYDLFLIEDCAQAHFTTSNGRNAGTFGDAGTFSFYPGKNLGAYGDAGAIVTNDDRLAKNVRMFANHGQLKKHDHWMEGINSRLDGIQAAILSVKLGYIDEWNKKRNEHGKLYNELLADVEEVQTPELRDNSFHTFHLYVIRADNRDGLKAFLDMKGVETAIHYPNPLPMLQAYKHMRYKPNDFPVANYYKDRILSLPMYPELTEEEIRTVVEEIKNYYLTLRL